MIELKSRIDEAAEVVLARVKRRPSIGIILGTGLGDVASALRRLCAPRAW